MENGQWQRGSATGGQEPLQQWQEGGATGGQEPLQQWQGGGAAGGQEPLREWQQETWVGPWPDAESPFDEPEDAPELRDLRSEELNNRSGDFWRTHTNGYAFGAAAGQQGQSAAPRTQAAGRERRAREQRRIWPLMVVIGLCVAAIIAVMYYVVFTVQEITVTGIVVQDAEMTAEEREAEQRRREAEIIALSGIQTGMPVFSLNTEEIEQRIEQNPNLIFRYLEKNLPSGVTLRVQEREACAWMSWNGIFYTMDRRGTVMYETEFLPEGMLPEKAKEESASGQAGESNPAVILTETGENPESTEGAEAQAQGQTEETDEEILQREVNAMAESLTRVDGLKIRSGTVAGQTLAFEEEEQRIVFDNLFIELKVLGCAELIAVADLSNTASLLLTTRDGFTIALGNSTELHAKLRSMLLTREELLRRDYHGGVINVNLPETPIFSPAI